METIKVYSTIEDKNIKKNLNDSPIWKKAIHADEIQELQHKYDSIFEYQIKFDGLKPVMVTKVSRFK
jgi:hypothetical protein